MFQTMSVTMQGCLAPLKEKIDFLYAEDIAATSYGYFTTSMDGRLIAAVDMGWQLGKAGWEAGKQFLKLVWEIVRPIIFYIGAFVCAAISRCGNEEYWNAKIKASIEYANPCGNYLPMPRLIVVPLVHIGAALGDFIGIFIPEVGRLARVYEPQITFDSTESATPAEYETDKPSVVSEGTPTKNDPQPFDEIPAQVDPI